MPFSWCTLLTFFTDVDENYRTNSQSGFVPKIELSYTQYSGFLKEVLTTTPSSTFKTCHGTAEYTRKAQRNAFLMRTRGFKMK